MKPVSIFVKELLEREHEHSKEVFTKLKKMSIRDKFKATFNEMKSEYFIKCFVEDFTESTLMDFYLEMDDKFLKEKLKRFK